MGVDYVPEADLYQVLELGPDASTDDIQQAHRRLIRVHHPDLGGDGGKASALNFARDVLVDPVERRRYDAQRSDYLERSRRRVPSVARPTLPPQPGSGIGTELVHADVRDALRSGDWVGALALGAFGIVVNQAVAGVVAHDPLARAALDALTELLRAERVDRERDSQVRARLATLEVRRQGLDARLKRARAAPRKPARKKGVGRP